MPEDEIGNAKDDFLATLRKRFKAAAEDEKHLREKFISDLKFSSPDGDDQWDPQVKLQREAAGRPAMSFPRCHIFVQQVANEARQNKPQIKFAPGKDSDKDTAEVYEGLARYIQYASDSQVAYDTAVEYSASASFGYYRFLTEYCEDDSDDLDLVIKPVLDPLTVYGVLVPSIFGRKPRYWFVVEDVPKEEFKALYPDAEMSSISWAEAEKTGEGWVGSDSVRVAEYWWVTDKPVKGKRRPATTIQFCRTNGLEILPDPDGESSKTDWPGTLCNIIPVLGSQKIIEGKPHLYSVVRPQKGAQQLINYTKSRIAETLSTSPISPFMIVEGQINGYEKQWETLNTSLRPFLIYKNVDNAGRPAPPPARQVAEAPIQALSAFVLQEVDDMKSTTGIFDASLGAQSNDVSGQAIQRRQQQGNLTTMHFMDNLSRSFRLGGDVIAELIPKIYDGAREIQILGMDEAPQVVEINQEFKDPQGNTKMHDMTKGKFKPIVTVGKAFDSKREETFDTMQQLIQSAPDLLPTFGDVMFQNSDMAGAEVLAERFRKMLPPQLQEQNQDIPPQAQAQIAQMHQQMTLAMQQAQQLQQEKQGKVWETQGKLQVVAAQHASDMVLEDKKLQTQLAVAEIQTKAQSQLARAKADSELTGQLHGQAHEAAMASAGAGQAQQTLQQGHAHEAGMQGQQQAGQSAQSAQDAQQGQDAAAQQAALQPSQSGGGE